MPTPATPLPGGSPGWNWSAEEICDKQAREEREAVEELIPAPEPSGPAAAVAQAAV